MKKLLILSLMCASAPLAQVPASLIHPSDSVDVGGEFAQLAELKSQLSLSLQSLPSHLQRVALYRLRADRREFSPGMIRYVQNQIEEAFFASKRDVVSAPELKTTRISSTDTSFQMSNAVSDAEELWKLGRKLRVDAFLDGGITRSKEGDLLLTLKLIRQESADVVWSQTFIAGPNEDRAKPAQFEFTADLGWNLWDVKKLVIGNSSADGGLAYYRYDANLGLQQVMDESRTWYIGVQGGMGYLSPVPDDPEDVFRSGASSIPFASVGIKLTKVIMPKADPIKGYNAGLYVGAKAIIPNSLMIGEVGFSSRPASHLGFSLGLNFMPFHRELGSGLVGRNLDLSYMESVSYDARIQAYLF